MNSNCLVGSLKCWTCTYGKCLTGIKYFGVEKTCKGFEPVCVKKESENKISRACYSSDTFVHLKTLDSSCLKYNGVKICYCIKGNCNSVSQFTLTSFWPCFLVSYHPMVGKQKYCDPNKYTLKRHSFFLSPSSFSQWSWLQQY